MEWPGSPKSRSATWWGPISPDFGFASRSHQSVFPGQRTGISARTTHQPSRQPIDFFESSPELILADGTVYPQKGKILLADRQVDRTPAPFAWLLHFRIPATFCAPASMGACGSRPASKKNALLVPQSAVKELQGGYQVALLGPDNKASIRPSRPAKNQDDVGDRRGPETGRPGVVEGLRK